MTDTAVHATFVVEREFLRSPSHVFAAFADAGLKRRWYASDDMASEAFASDFRVGGLEHTRARLGEDTPFPGIILENNSIHLDIVPNRRVVIGSRMSMGNRPISASLITFEFLPQDSKTLLRCTHQGAFFEGSDGSERREAGWNRLIDRLERALAA